MSGQYMSVPQFYTVKGLEVLAELATAAGRTDDAKKCTREVETITTKWCKLEYEKTCTTETKAFTKITGYEKGDCKEVEYCKPVYGKGCNVVLNK